MIRIKKGYKGVHFLGFLFIIGSLYYLVVSLNFEYYKFIFQQLPERNIIFRYVFSLLMRSFGIVLGLGIILRKNFFRKAAIFFCWFTILTVLWRSPFYVFNNIAIATEYDVTNVMGNYPLKYPWHPWFSMIFFYSIDIIFSFIVIYFLNRPQVKDQFK